MAEPLISIIIPCFNASFYLEKVIESVVHQSYKNFECLMINDGSTDTTWEIIQAISDERFRKFSHENVGLSATRNFGIEQAKGDYLFFCDSDDLLLEHTLQTFIEHKKGTEAIIVGKTAQYSWTEQKIVGELPQPKSEILFTDQAEEILLGNIFNQYSPIAQNKLYKTSFIKTAHLRFKNGIYHEDELWFFETVLNAKEIRFIPEITYLYTVDNTSSITKVVKDKNLQGYTEIIDTIYHKYFIENTDNQTIALYLVYLKKLAMQLYLTQDFHFSEKSIQRILTTFKTCNPQLKRSEKVNENVFAYFSYINKISLKDLHAIRKYYFNFPANSLRKKWKMMQFNILHK